MFTSLGHNTPPKGEASDWKEKTGALVEAAKEADADKLKKATNCMAGHSLHKDKKDEVNGTKQPG